MKRRTFLGAALWPAINTGAAQAIGLQVPESLLLRADVVVD